MGARKPEGSCEAGAWGSFGNTYPKVCIFGGEGGSFLPIINSFIPTNKSLRGAETQLQGTCPSGWCFRSKGSTTHPLQAWEGFDLFFHLGLDPLKENTAPPYKEGEVSSRKPAAPPPSLVGAALSWRRAHAFLSPHLQPQPCQNSWEGGLFSSPPQGQPCSLCCCCSLISRWPRHGLPGTRLLPSRPRGDASLHQLPPPTPPRLWHPGPLPLCGPRHPLLPRCGLPQNLSLASCTVGPPPGKGGTGAGTPSLFVTSAHLTLPVGTSARSPWREGSSLDPGINVGSSNQTNMKTKTVTFCKLILR